MNDICGFIFLIGTGMSFLIFGILMRLGVSKSWFYPSTGLRDAPVMGFGMIPMGLGVLALAFSLMAGEYGWLGRQSVSFLIFGVSFPVFFLGFVFMAWRPHWLKPRWFRWLEDNYGDIIGELRKDAQRLDRAWLDRVRTREGLEQWAEEVRQRHQAGSEPPK